MSEYYRRQDPRTCIVGYALNPKKLRKSNSEIGDLTPPTTSCRKQLGVSTPCKSDNDSPPLVPLGTEVSVQSQLQLIWRGGGLADIVSGGLTCEGVQFVQWFPEIPANEQPHFDVIIHKLTEDIEKSSDKIRSLEHYLKLNPETIIIDPLDSVRNVVSRARSCECLRRVQNRLGNSCPFTQPNFFIATTGTAYAAATANTNANIVSSIVSDGDDSKHTVERDVETELLSTQTARNASELGSGVHIGVVNTPDDMLALMHREGLKFPIICKPVEACGTARSHSMLVVVSPEGLSLVEPPCVVQQYRDHDAFFYKVYVMDDEVMVFQRGSLPNIEPYIASSKNIHDMGNKSTSAAPCSQLCPGSSNSSRSRTTSATDDGPACNNCSNSSSSSATIHAGSCSQRRLCSVAFDSRNAYPSLEDFFEPLDEFDDLGTDKDFSRLRRSNRANSSISESGRRGGGKETPIDRDCLGSRLVSEERFRAAAKAIRAEFGLSLFGFDVIVPCTPFFMANGGGASSSTAAQTESTTVGQPQPQQVPLPPSAPSTSSSSLLSSSTVIGSTGNTTSASTEANNSSDCNNTASSAAASELELVVIDINFFPSYKEVPDFPSRLRAFLRRKAGLS